MITQVHRIYDRRQDVFKYVVICDALENPFAVLNAAGIPKLDSEVTTDDGRLFKVTGHSSQQTEHPLIWEVSLDVAEMELTIPKFYGSIGSLVASRSTSPEPVSTRIKV